MSMQKVDVDVCMRMHVWTCVDGVFMGSVDHIYRAVTTV